MYYTNEMLLNKEPEKARRATGLQEPRSRERAGLEKEPLNSKRETLFRRKWFKGAPAGEHGAGSRVTSPTPVRFPPSARERPPGFESPIPG